MIIMFIMLIIIPVPEAMLRQQQKRFLFFLLHLVPLLHLLLLCRGEKRMMKKNQPLVGATLGQTERDDEEQRVT